MDPALKHWLGLWDYLDGNFWAVWRWATSFLTPEEAGWQPVPRVASVGWNLQHLAEMLDYYLVNVFRQGPAVRAELPTMRSGSRDDGRFRDLEAVADYHRRVRPAYRSFLAGLAASATSPVSEDGYCPTSRRYWSSAFSIASIWARATFTSDLPI